MMHRAGILLSVTGLSLVLASCATEGGPGTSTAPMDFAMDTGGGRMFYKGTAFIPRGFHSSEAFDLEVHLRRWGNPPANETSQTVLHVLKNEFEGTGHFLPLGNGAGEIQFAPGRRLQLRGAVLDEGQELDGEWYLDGKLGGGFRIVRKGQLFP